MALHEDREDFDLLHPILVSEALFSTAIIFRLVISSVLNVCMPYCLTFSINFSIFLLSNRSTLKVVYIFSINPYLGPLQIVLGRVILDIAKFFLLYVLVLLAFTNGELHERTVSLAHVFVTRTWALSSVVFVFFDDYFPQEYINYSHRIRKFRKNGVTRI